MRRLFSRRWPWVVSTLVHGIALAALALNLVDMRSKAASVPAPIEMALSLQIATPTEPQPEQAKPVETARAVPQVTPPDRVKPVEARPDMTEVQPPDEIEEQRPEEVTLAEAIPLVEPMPELAETQAVVPTEARPVPPPPPPKPVVKPSTPVVARTPPPPAPPSPTSPVTAPIQAAAPPAAAPSPPQLAALPPSVGRPGADADYFAVILAWLEKHKEYPRQSQLRRQQGTAVLHFELDREGRVLSYRIRTSSGFPELDREVEAMLKRAEPLPPMPAEMTQARLELQVPVQFRLR